MRKQNRFLFLAATAMLMTWLLTSCDKNDKKPKREHPKYNVTYHLELDDGTNTEVFSNGSEKDVLPNYTNLNAQTNWLYLMTDGLNDNRPITIFISTLLDAQNNLYPLGSQVTEPITGDPVISGLEVWIHNDWEWKFGTGIHNDTFHVAGAQSISNINFYPVGGEDSKSGKATFRYDFDDVVLLNDDGAFAYYASGYILCVKE